jgi:polyisoprenoid-binding protein YceI
MRRSLKWVLGGLLGLAVLIVGGTYFYIHVIEGPAPKRLTLNSTPTTTAGAAADPSSSSSSATPSGGVSGTWQPTTDSQVGYRVNEVLFGQNNAAVGRTNKVTGSMAIDGTTVKSVDLSVDMASVTSDQSRRDGQFRGRIMDVTSFPTATFKLTKPIQLSSVPTDSSVVTTKATGDLTLHGTTKSVTVDLRSKRDGAKIDINGTIPITFADWGIPNPSNGPVTTEDHGELEMLVVFTKSA